MIDQPAAPAADIDARFRRVVAVLIAVVTTAIALVSYLQSDAGARDDAANRDTKRYAMEALGRRISGDARVNYDYNSAYQTYSELDLLAAGAANVGDAQAAARYAALRDRVPALSPLLAAPYFDPASGALNVAKYEADVYLVEITALTERFTAASAVKDAWDGKANTYIVHLTLLAVALFLYGLSTTVSGGATRLVFTGAGTAIALVAAAWAGLTYLRPVSDLRDCLTAGGAPAIDAYAQGVGLAYQHEYEQAIGRFDAAIACAPDYAAAWVARAEARAALGDYGTAIGDYEAAQQAGNRQAYVAGDLAWLYYLTGRFDEAIAQNRRALAVSPDELWIQFDLGLSLLASGQAGAAQAEYARGMDLATQQVQAAQAARQAPPSYLWWGLGDAAAGLDDLMTTLRTGEGEPALNTLSSAPEVMPTAERLLNQLKSLAVALEFTGRPPTGELTATISPFTLAQPVYDEAGELVDYAVADTFAYGIDEVSVLFDYSGARDGDEVIFKMYIDGEEDPSWRFIETWDLGSDGSAEIPLSLAYSNTAVFAPGEYTVEMYLANHLAQRGTFSVEE
ncbi:MAG: tetratricopeptide repeat protein [Anaerolineales bacterium]|nr:tetratricopeptide repeat protein [Anaerolineales bacterium]